LAMSERFALTVDGAIDLALGMLLLLFPRGVLTILGMPLAASAFYPSILGAVLVGIGLALLLQRFGGDSGVAGLSMEGAVAINLCGAAALVAWLIGGTLDIPRRGYALLWLIALTVLGVAVVEIALRILRGGETRRA
jgi:hypothetical protein